MFLFPDSAETSRDSVGCDASAPRPPSGVVPARPLTASRKAGSSPNTAASLWSLRPCATRSIAVRSRLASGWRTLPGSRASDSLPASHRTIRLRHSTSRPETAPESPVIRSSRASTLTDLLKLGVQTIIFTLT